MFVVALDLGGSHLSCAITRERELIWRRDIRVDPSSFRQLLPVIAELIRSGLSELDLRPEDCDGIVLGFPGIVDSRHGMVIATNAKFNDAVGMKLSEWAIEKLGIPLIIENDARLALIGEHDHGAAKGAADAVLITLGTGIGVAAMLDGKPLRGKYDQAGCLGGHIPVVVGGRYCTCGNRGCAEAEASTWALPLICRAWPGFERSELASFQTIDFEKLFAAVDREDSIAKEIADYCCSVWATLAVGLIHAYSPQILLFSGGVMARADRILPFICAHVRRHAWTPRGAVKIKIAALGTSAPLYGALPRIKEGLVR